VANLSDPLKLQNFQQNGNYLVFCDYKQMNMVEIMEYCFLYFSYRSVACLAENSLRQTVQHNLLYLYYSIFVVLAGPELIHEQRPIA